MKEGEAGRGRAWSKGREGGREGGGREAGARQAGGGRREGRVNAQCQTCTEACQWLLAFTLY